MEESAAEFLKLGKKLYEITRKDVGYSPYITNLITTTVGTVGYDLQDVVIYDVSNLLDDIVDNNGNKLLTYEVFRDYLNYLKTGKFEYIPLIVMNYLGHDTYDLELLLQQWIALGSDFVPKYIKMRFEDEWIRDNMYRLNLNDDPYYGLNNIVIHPDSAKHCENIIAQLKSIFEDVEFNIAGGYVYALTNPSINYEDIDLFFTGDNCDKAIEKLRTSTIVERLYISDNSLSFRVRVSTIPGWKFNHYQVVLRRYTSPTEIVHGFDIDCSGLLINSNKPNIIYHTNRALFSINNKTIVFDVKRMSSTYCYRLQKYMYKSPDYTMKIYFPNQQRVRDMFYSNISNLINHVDGSEDIDINVKKFKAKYYDKLKPTLVRLGMDYSDSMLWFKLAIAYNKKCWLKKKGKLFNDASNCIFLLDIFRAKIRKGYDYSDKRVTKNVKKEVLVNIRWKEQDPMTQITSTFNPKIYPNFDVFFDTNNMEELYREQEIGSNDNELSESDEEKLTQ